MWPAPGDPQAAQFCLDYRTAHARDPGTRSQLGRPVGGRSPTRKRKDVPMKRRLHRTIAVLGGLSLAASAHQAYAGGLAVPTGVEAHPPSSGSMVVFWNAAAGATSYNIYRSTTS